MTAQTAAPQNFIGSVRLRLGLSPRAGAKLKHAIERAGLLSSYARLPAEDLLAELHTSAEGLTDAEAAARLVRAGPNVIAREKEKSALQELGGRAKNPLNALLLSLAAVSWVTGDPRAAIVICVMVVLSIMLAFLQEHRSNQAAAKLRAMVKTRVSVRRRPDAGPPRTLDIPIDQLTPGDIVLLGAGDMAPADLRLLSCKTLHVNQSALTGEAMPVDKFEKTPAPEIDDPFEFDNICFMGSNVLSGVATGVILQTGTATYFGKLADSMVGERVLTSFDRGVTRFTWLMVRFICVMVPAVFLINGLTKGDWLEALLFAVAAAVGLTPEMLPMIATVNLAKGAMAMAREQVIVKRLNAIQNFGAMDVLCTDKTGTLTQDRVILQYHLDFEGEESERVLEYAYLNSYYHSGLKNLLDEAVLTYVNRPEHVGRVGFHEGGRNPLRFPAPAHVGGARRRRRPSDDHQGRGRGGAGGLRQLCPRRRRRQVGPDPSRRRQEGRWAS